MAFEDVLLTTIQVVASVFVMLFITFYFSNKLKSFEKIGVFADTIIGKNPELEVNLGEISKSIGDLGKGAALVNQIFESEEALDGLLHTVAQKSVKIFQMSLLGTKSGDSRTMAKAEQLVDDGMVSFLANLHPAIGLFLEASGIGAELQENPKLLGYVIQAVQSRGLLNMVDLSSLGIPALGTAQPQQQAIGKDFIG